MLEKNEWICHNCGLKIIDYISYKKHMNTGKPCIEEYEKNMLEKVKRYLIYHLLMFKIQNLDEFVS